MATVAATLAHAKEKLRNWGFESRPVGGRLIITHRDGLTVDRHTLSRIEILFAWNDGLPNLTREAIINTLNAAETGYTQALKQQEKTRKITSMQEAVPGIKQSIADFVGHRPQMASLNLQATWTGKAIVIGNSLHPELFFHWEPSQGERQLEKFSDFLLDYDHALRTLEKQGRLTRDETDASLVIDGKKVNTGRDYKTTVRSVVGALHKDERRQALESAQAEAVRKADARAIKESAERQEYAAKLEAHRNDPVVLVMDAGPLIDLAAPRKGSKGKTWLDLLEMTSQLPNVTVVIPAHVANFETRGLLEQWNGHDVVARTVNTSFKAPPEGMALRHTAASKLTQLFNTAYRARRNEQGKIEIKSPAVNANPHLIIWETDLCREYADDILHGKKYTLEHHLGQNEGERTIKQFLEHEIPFDHHVIVISDDINFQQGDAPRYTHTGQPVGYAGVRDYLEAEFDARCKSICARLKLENGGRKLTQAVNDIMEHAKEDERQVFERSRIHPEVQPYRSHAKRRPHEEMGVYSEGNRALCLQEIFQNNVASNISASKSVNLLEPFHDVQNVVKAHDMLGREIQGRITDLRIDEETLVECCNQANRARYGKKRQDIISLAQLRQIIQGTLCPNERQMGALAAVLLYERKSTDERWQRQSERQLWSAYEARVRNAEVEVADASSVHVNGEASLSTLLQKLLKKDDLGVVVQEMNKPGKYYRQEAHYTQGDVQAVLDGQAPANAEFVARFLTGVDSSRAGRGAPQLDESAKHKVFLALGEEHCRAINPPPAAMGIVELE